MQTFHAVGDDDDRAAAVGQRAQATASGVTELRCSLRMGRYGTVRSRLTWSANQGTMRSVKPVGMHLLHGDDTSWVKLLLI